METDNVALVEACEVCNKDIIYKEYQLFDGMCRKCYEEGEKCEECGARITFEESDNNDNGLCNKCTSMVCDECGEIYNKLYDGKCSSCADEDFYAEIVLDTYYTPNKLLFNKTKENENLFMGFELEVERKDELAGIGAKNLVDFLEKENINGLFYLKEDGSLSNGFEIVSHPCTLNFIKQKMKLDKILFWLGKNKFQSYLGGNCGFHIHLSRNFFTKEDLIKMRIFFSLYAKKLYKFSKRDRFDNSYCLYEKLEVDSFLNEEGQNNRYWALNFNTDKKTIEIRIFRGNLKYNIIQSYLEFAEALSIFIKKYTLQKIVTIAKRNDDEMWNSFKEYINGYKIKYKYLKKELKW